MGNGQKAAMQTAMDDAIATAGRLNEMLFTLGTKTVQSVVGSAAQQATTTGEETAAAAHRLIETATETVGRTVEPVASNPLITYMAKIPGLNWLLNALGKVDTHKAQQEVLQLQQKYPNDTPEQIAHRRVATHQSSAIGFAGVVVGGRHGRHRVVAHRIERHARGGRIDSHRYLELARCFAWSQCAGDHDRCCQFGSW